MAGRGNGANELVFCAAGDVGPHRADEEYPVHDPIFPLAAPIFKAADVSFCQFERVLSNSLKRSWVGSAAHPDNVRELIDGGFNVVSIAGNHHMDGGVNAFVDTLEVLKKNNIKVVGGGMNIAEARAPAIFEKNGVRLGIIGYSSVIPKAEIHYDAGPSRPGCAPMFVDTYYGASDWQAGTPSPNIVTIPDAEDLSALIEDVKRTKADVDAVVVSMHWGVHRIPSMIASYEYQVGHAAIDAGADMVIGHHAHILKAVEVYKGKPIFHCLGNFGLDKGLYPDDRMFDALHHPKRDPNYPTFGGSVDGRKTIIVTCRVGKGGITRVSYMPCLINRLGQPEPLPSSDKRSDEVVDYVAWATKDQKHETKFMRDGDEVVVGMD
jgi:poly-gamma-glutamate synthesis protein (capsule biosynthesis protein)